jgi:hypothetical protein
MSGVIKPLGVSISCNTVNVNTYSNAKLVRLTCSAVTTTGHVITCKYANGVINYSVGITGGQSLILEKSPTDTLESTDVSSTVLRGTPIAYRN